MNRHNSECCLENNLAPASKENAVKILIFQINNYANYTKAYQGTRRTASGHQSARCLGRIRNGHICIVLINLEKQCSQNSSITTENNKFATRWNNNYYWIWACIWIKNRRLRQFRTLWVFRMCFLSQFTVSSIANTNYKWRNQKKWIYSIQRSKIQQMLIKVW